MTFFRVLFRPTFLLELRRLRVENQRLREQLETERSRHLVREEALIDRILTSKGHQALPKTDSPGTFTEKKLPPLNALQLAEREAWADFAREAGKDPSEGRRDWDKDHGRLRLND